MKNLLILLLAFWISGEWVLKDGSVHRYTVVVESIPDKDWLDHPENATGYFRSLFHPDLVPEKIQYLQHLFIVPIEGKGKL